MVEVELLHIEQGDEDLCGGKCRNDKEVYLGERGKSGRYS